MGNLKQFDLDKLDALPKRQSIHCQYTTPFSKMDSMWDSQREDHGRWIWARVRALIKGSDGKSRSWIVSRMKEFWPKNFYRSISEELSYFMDYRCKIVDGVYIMTPRYRYREHDVTLEDIVGDKRLRRYDIYYFDPQNILRVIPAIRKNTNQRPKKAYYEEKQKRRLEEKNRQETKEYRFTISWRLANLPEHRLIYRDLLRKWESANTTIATHNDQKYDKGSMWWSWDRYRVKEAKKEVALYSDIVHDIYLGKLDYLNQEVAKVEADRMAKLHRKELMAA